MAEHKLKIFWSDPDVSESFYYDPPGAWQGRDPADYHAYVMEYSHEFRLCRSLGIDADNFLPKYRFKELDDKEEVTSDVTE